MNLTDSFTWEDLPTRDADTGQLTAAGWIQRVKMFSTGLSIVTVSFYCIQSIIRIRTNREAIITAWYPFDRTVSPFYELVIVSQVNISVNKERQNSRQSLCVVFVIYSTGLSDTLLLLYPSFTVSFFR